MRAGVREWLAASAALGLWIGACVDSGGGNNDSTLPTGDAGLGSVGATPGASGGTSGTAGSTPGGTASAGGTTPGGIASAGGTTPGGIASAGGTTPGGIASAGGTTPGGTAATAGGTTATGGTPGGAGDAGVDSGTPGGSSGGTTGGTWMMPATSAVKGTAATANCSSYGPPAGDKCGGWYCGVTQAVFAPEVNPNGKCGGGDLAFVCSNKLVLAVGKCARDTKLKPENLLATNEELRPMVKACVYQDAEIMQKVNDNCLGCFLDAAECAGTNCVFECIDGDSAGCDTCRKTNNCEQPVPACAGYPSPF